MHELAEDGRAERDADVRGRARFKARRCGREEEDVASLNAIEVNRMARAELFADRPRQGQLLLVEDVADQAAAVESAPRVLAAEPIPRAAK